MVKTFTASKHKSVSSEVRLHTVRGNGGLHCELFVADVHQRNAPTGEGDTTAPQGPEQGGVRVLYVAPITLSSVNV